MTLHIVKIAVGLMRILTVNEIGIDGCRCLAIQLIRLLTAKEVGDVKAK